MVDPLSSNGDHRTFVETFHRLDLGLKLTIGAVTALLWRCM